MKELRKIKNLIQLRLRHQNNNNLTYNCKYMYQVNTNQDYETLFNEIKILYGSTCDIIHINNMKKILVTGAVGFIGMHTSIKFIEGFEVIGIDNLNDYYSTEFKMMRLKEIKKISNKLNSKWTLEADISNDSIWNNLKKYNIDRVVHLLHKQV